MQALTYWKTVTMDKSNLIEQLFALLDEHQIRYCLTAPRISPAAPIRPRDEAGVAYAR